MLFVYFLFGLVLGLGFGRGFAYTRYGDKKAVEELRRQHKDLQHQYESMQIGWKDIEDQNKILKQQAQLLLTQNEDYSKMVSALSRYHYIIKQGSGKLKELMDIMGVYDEDLEKKLEHMLDDQVGAFDEQTIQVDNGEQKYF